MKLKFLLPCIIAVFWAATVWGAVSGERALQTGVFLFPVIEVQTVTDGLDARDSNNCAMVSQRAQQGLRDIFLSGLFSLLMQGELYTYARAGELLKRRMGFGAHALAAAANGAVARVVDAILSSRTWKNILAALIAVFAFGFLKLVVRSIPSFTPQNMLLSAAPVVLRC